MPCSPDPHAAGFGVDEIASLRRPTSVRMIWTSASVQGFLFRLLPCFPHDAFSVASMLPALTFFLPTGDLGRRPPHVLKPRGCDFT